MEMTRHYTKPTAVRAVAGESNSDATHAADPSVEEAVGVVEELSEGWQIAADAITMPRGESLSAWAYAREAEITRIGDQAQEAEGMALDASRNDVMRLRDVAGCSEEAESAKTLACMAVILSVAALVLSVAAMLSWTGVA